MQGEDSVDDNVSILEVVLYLLGHSQTRGAAAGWARGGWERVQWGQAVRGVHAQVVCAQGQASIDVVGHLFQKKNC